MSQSANLHAHPLAAAAVWEPTRRLTLEQARERSRTLSAVRLVLVGLAAVSFSTFFGFMTLHAALGGFAPTDEIAVSETQKMISPRFLGRSSSGERFMIVSETASRRAGEPELIDLFRPRYEAENGRRVMAAGGVYNERTRAIELIGDVVLTDRQGNTFSSVSASIDSGADIVLGMRAIRGSGPLGSVRADSYEVREGGASITLRGRVKGTVNQGKISQ